MASSYLRDGDFKQHVSAFLDGVPVKIGEKFKPPRRVTLPVSYQHHRYATDLLNQQYDLTLERQIVEHSESRWRKRLEAERSKQDRLATEIEQFTRVSPLTVRGSESVTSGEQVASTNSTEETSTAPPEPQTTSLRGLEPSIILQPTPGQQNSKPNPDPTQPRLNLADFEEESSPFDSVELKTLNDFEELKSVLSSVGGSSGGSTAGRGVYTTPSNTQGSCEVSVAPRGVYTGPSNTLGSSEVSVAPRGMYMAPSHYQPQTPVTIDSGRGSYPAPPPATNPYLSAPTSSSLPSYNPPYPLPPSSNPYCSGFELPEPAVHVSKSTPDLLKELDRADRRKKHGGSSRRTETWSHVPQLPDPGPPDLPVAGLSDPYNLLTAEGQGFVHQIADMGFPRVHVSRAVHRIGTDYKKVIDHVCLMESLVRSGFEPHHVEHALFLHNHDELQSRQFLELSVQFRDLGFSDDVIERALLASKNDRDKALDILVS